MNKTLELLATGFGLGYLPKAPGTYGTLLGLPLAWLVFKISDLTSGSAPKFIGHLNLLGFTSGFILLLIASVISYYIIRHVEHLWQSHDDGRIVIDEIIGVAFTLYCFEPTFLSYGIGFLLFRLFDIWKPGIVGWADQKVPGAFGTLLDDIFAGWIALFLMVGISLIFRDFF